MRLQIKTLISIFSIVLLSACSPSGDNSTDKQQTSESKTDAAAVQTAEQAAKQASDFPFVFEKVANNTWVMHGPRELPNPENKGFMNNPAIVKTSAGLVMVDPGSTVHVGNNVLAELKKVSDEPIVAIFNTHIHGDHWLANQSVIALYPKVKIYGHPEMLVEIENGEGENWVNTMNTLTEGASLGTEVVPPNLTADNTDVIKVGDTQFKIHHYGVSHTKTDIMI